MKLKEKYIVDENGDRIGVILDIIEYQKLLEALEGLESIPFEETVAEAKQDYSVRVPTGVPGKNLLHFAGTISASDLQEMAQAIEAGCEQVDLDEW
jgi:hypothetical protein